MINYCKQKEIKALVKSGAATDLTMLSMDELTAIRTRSENVAISCGVNGVNGGVWRDIYNGKKYAVPGRSSALFVML